MVSYFNGSVQGLGPGSPVTFQGLRVGQVLSVDIEYDAATDNLRVPVRYEIEPERIAGVKLVEGRGPLANVAAAREPGPARPAAEREPAHGPEDDRHDHRAGCFPCGGQGGGATCS